MSYSPGPSTPPPLYGTVPYPFQEPRSPTFHPALVTGNYDMRFPPTQHNLPFLPAELMAPASRPPLPSLAVRVGQLPWVCDVHPGQTSQRNPIVTVLDVLNAVYAHLRTAVTAEEYNTLDRQRKAQIYAAFESRVGTDSAQRPRGLRRVDFLPSPLLATSSLVLSRSPVPAPLPQVYTPPLFPHAPSDSLNSGVYIHPALASPALQYDLRFSPTPAGLPISPTVLKTAASNPPQPSLVLHIDQLPWALNVSPPRPSNPSDDVVVSVLDVLNAIHTYFHTVVTLDEYGVMDRQHGMEVRAAFARRVGLDASERARGFCRIDFLGAQVHAQGLVRAPERGNNAWDIVII
ncbi:hypothetical protein BC834DRAFT_975475 [Gloeopeniophorella convolvens]|nr:hypothetical protein BC834DRAFT_975475 [Gloeopeniophorella convolvens]